jgi:hypothetical protein
MLPDEVMSCGLIGSSGWLTVCGGSVRYRLCPAGDGCQTIISTRENHPLLLQASNTNCMTLVVTMKACQKLIRLLLVGLNTDFLI